MSYRKKTGLLLALAVTLSGQTKVDLRSQSKNLDFTQAPATAPVKVGSSLPGSCNVGELFYNAAAIQPGQNLYGCTAVNTWSLLGDGGSGGGGGGIITQKTGTGDPNGVQTCSAPSTTTRTVYFDTAARITWQCTAANTWRRILDSTGTGPVVIQGDFSVPDLTEPTTTGQGALQFGDSTLEYFPKAGALSRTVIPKDCGGDVVRAISPNGTVTCTTPIAVRATDTQTGRTSSITSGNLATSLPAGLYRINTYVATTTTEGAACLLNTAIGYTYAGGVKTLQTISGHNLNAVGGTGSVQLVQIDADTAITRTLTSTCSRTAYLYNYTIVLEKVN